MAERQADGHEVPVVGERGHEFGGQHADHVFGASFEVGEVDGLVLEIPPARRRHAGKLDRQRDSAVPQRRGAGGRRRGGDVEAVPVEVTAGVFGGGQLDLPVGAAEREAVLEAPGVPRVAGGRTHRPRGGLRVPVEQGRDRRLQAGRGQAGDLCERGDVERRVGEATREGEAVQRAAREQTLAGVVVDGGGEREGGLQRGPHRLGCDGEEGTTHAEAELGGEAAASRGGVGGDVLGLDARLERRVGGATRSGAVDRGEVDGELDAHGGGRVLAAELAELNLTGEQPRRVGDAGGEPGLERGLSEARFDAGERPDRRGRQGGDEVFEELGHQRMCWREREAMS